MNFSTFLKKERIVLLNVEYNIPKLPEKTSFTYSPVNKDGVVSVRALGEWALKESLVFKKAKSGLQPPEIYYGCSALAGQLQDIAVACLGEETVRKRLEEIK